MRVGFKPMWRFLTVVLCALTVTLVQVHAIACQSFTRLKLCQSIACKRGDAPLSRTSGERVSKSSWTVAHLIVGLCLANTCRQSSIKAAMFWGASSGTFKGRNWPLMGISPVQISHSSTPAENAVASWQNTRL